MTAKTGSRKAAALQGPVYLDSSALVKLYLPEAESTALEAILLGRSDLWVSDLAVTEVVSAASRRARDGQLKAADLIRLHGVLLDDLAGGAFLAVQLDAASHRAAERLLIQANPALRAADALHLAMALATGTRTLVTYDQRLAAAASAAGLHAVAPG